MITSKKHAYRPETSYVLYYSLNSAGDMIIPNLERLLREPPPRKNKESREPSDVLFFARKSLEVSDDHFSAQQQYRIESFLVASGYSDKSARMKSILPIVCSFLFLFSLSAGG